MRRIQALGMLLLLPALAVVMTTPGCSKKDEPAPKGGKGNDQVGKGSNKGAPKPAEMKELASTGWGTLTGKVTYDGDPPAEPKLNMSGNKDEKACHEGAKEKEIVEQLWLVNKETKGVENVVIYLRAPEDTYFKIKDEDKNRKGKSVLIHQPHCAFLPHVSVHFPAYYDKDTGDLKRTGEIVVVKNDATFNHNTAWSGSEGQPKGSLTLQPGQDLSIKEINPDADAPMSLKCDIHSWMNAKCWAFDHPYAARTDKDGKFEIKNVPTGVEVHVVGWHEGAKYFNGGKNGTPLTLKDGETKKLDDIKVKK